MVFLRVSNLTPRGQLVFCREPHLGLRKPSRRVDHPLLAREPRRLQRRFAHPPCARGLLAVGLRCFLAGSHARWLDAKGPAMKPRFLLLLFLTLLLPAPARAHVGSPDVFYDGKVGPWPVRITIRMPGVVPGRAEIIAQIQSSDPVTVSFTPLSARIAVSNAPPAEVAQPVRGETNLYSGELWFMTTDAYRIDVH